jgi:hypothetical protein
MHSFDLSGLWQGQGAQSHEGDAESLLQLQLAKTQKIALSRNSAYFHVNRFILEILKFYIRITSAS